MKITRCEYFKKKGEPSISIGTSWAGSDTIFYNITEKINPSNKGTILAFKALFDYELYDQYKSHLIESEQGKATPAVKEELLRDFTLFDRETDYTRQWDPCKECEFQDEIEISYKLSELTFPIDYIYNGMSAMQVSLMWFASVQDGLHKKNIVKHGAFTNFISVKRDNDGRVKSFKFITIYFRGPRQGLLN